jgi:hypothetical protein
MIDTIVHGRFVNLARELAGKGFQTERYRKGEIVNAGGKAFLYYPRERFVANKPDGYDAMRQFFYYHKRGQKRAMSDHFNVPTDHEDCDPPYVVRSVKHFGGRHFYIAEDEGDLQEAVRKIRQNAPDERWYASEVFRRTREFRSFFVGGEHVVTMLKRIDGAGYAEAEDMPDPDNDERQLSPWNRDHEGTDFLTINREQNNKLLDTEFFEHAESFLGEYPLDFIAFDTGYNDHTGEYTVFEANFAPGLTVDSALEPISQQIRDLR